jgi:hypothetical protein
MRTVTKRINYAGVTTRVRLMRGVYLRSGSFIPQRITEEQLLFQDTGFLFFTNNRLIFNGCKKNVVLTRKTIVGINPKRDAIEVEKTAGRNPVFVNKDYRRAICMNAAASRFLEGENIRPMSQPSERFVTGGSERKEVLAGMIAAFNAFKPYLRQLNDVISAHGDAMVGEPIESYLKAVRAFVGTGKRLLEYTALLPEELRRRLGLALETVEATQMCFEVDAKSGPMTNNALVPLLDSVTALVEMWGTVAEHLAADRE